MDLDAIIVSLLAANTLVSSRICCSICSQPGPSRHHSHLHHHHHRTPYIAIAEYRLNKPIYSIYNHALLTLTLTLLILCINLE